MSEYSTKTVVQLKELLKTRGLPTAGKKEELVQRLTESDASGADGSVDTEVSTTETKPADEETAKPDTNTSESTETKPVESSESTGNAENSATNDSAASAAATEHKQEPEAPPSETPEQKMQKQLAELEKRIARAKRFGDTETEKEAERLMARIKKFGVPEADFQFGIASSGLSTELKIQKRGRGNEKPRRKSVNEKVVGKVSGKASGGSVAAVNLASADKEKIEARRAKFGTVPL